MSDPAFRSSSSVANSSGAVTVTKPAGCVDGDLLTAFQVTALGGGTNPATPSGGWVLKDSQTYSGGKIIQWFEKLASSEPASWTFNQPGGSPLGNEVSVYCICTSAGATASEGGSKGTNTGTTADPGAYTTTNANDLILTVWAANPGVTSAITPDGSYTPLAQIGSLSGQRVRVGYKTQAAAGAVGSRAATLSESMVWGSMLVAIAPSASSGPSAATLRARRRFGRMIGRRGY